jgi:uncharacterized membrane protein YcgQ (UPF0703/DUF1980 family)
VIELDNYGYGIFFIDAMDHLDRYLGKKIKYLAQVMKPEGVGSNFFVPGRMAMTCCADDMTFLGYLCRYEQASKLENRDWITITARVGKAALPEYEGNEGPVLDAVTIEPAQAPSPRDQVITFN